MPDGRSLTRLARALGLPLLTLGAVGCASIGPGTVPRDRTDYITAVAESWKEQTLLNAVRIRYGDAPSFVDVSSVINSYSFASQVEATGQIPPNAAPPFPLSILGANAGYVDRPTITYTPVIGDKFARSLLRPIPPSAIFELIQAGYPADTILQLTARGINGLYNRSSQGGEVREADPDFYAVLEALRRLQLSGAVALRMEKRGADDVGILIFSRDRAGANDPDYRFLLKTLRVEPGDKGEITLAFGAQPRSEKEIAILSRSMLSILGEVANGIDVPGANVAAGRVGPASRTPEAPDPHDRPLVRILSGPKPPADAYAEVRYRNVWYWIRDDDLPSKRVFSFLMMFFALAETGVAAQPPVITIPAG